MKPFSRTILGLFDGKRRYVIPLFQRQYVWQEERQLKPLWDDIMAKAMGRLENKEPRPHFLGAIVLDQLKTFGDQVPAQIVIDGQQRLTTFQILLAAFRDFAVANGNNKYADDFHDVTENKGTMENRDIERFKVWPTHVDQPQFMTCLSSKSKEEVKSQLNKSHARKITGIEPHMIRAYLYFYEAFELFRDDPETQQYSLHQKIESLYRALSKNLEIVSIELEGDDDPQIIFETLNARGEPLLASDLLRNYIFLKASQRNEDSAELYNTYWLRFDQSFWKTEEKQGRLKRPRIDIFFQHLLQAKTGEEISVSHLYVDYKQWIKDTDPFSSVADELTLLNHYADRFEKLIAATDTDLLGRFSKVLTILDVKTIYPLLLFLACDAQVADEELAGILTDLESYLVRRLVCGYTGKNYNKFFLQLLRDMRSSTASRARLRELLVAGVNEPTAWPDDATFHSAWRSNNCYTLARGGRLTLILSKIEFAMRTSKSENMPLPKNMTVEHIMPQSWEAHWPLPDGRTAAARLNRLFSQDRDASADYRDSVIHTIGNLTLLTTSLNPSIGNAGYEEKRQEILKHSELALNRYFHDIDRDVWNEDKIAKRADNLFSFAVKVWPYPPRVSSGDAG